MTRPIRKFDSGSVSVAIWTNEIETANGPKKVERVSVERRYKDDRTGEWRSTTSFRENELPRLILALQKAYEYLAFKKHDADEGDDGHGKPVVSEVG